MSDVIIIDKKSFFIPVQPVPKGRGKISKGRIFTPDKTRDYAKEVRAHASKLGFYKWLGDWKGPVGTLEIYNFDRFKYNAKAKGKPWHTKKPDVDNVFKGLTDPMFEYDQAICVSLSLKVFRGINCKPGTELVVVKFSMDTTRSQILDILNVEAKRSEFD